MKIHTNALLSLAAGMELLYDGFTTPGVEVTFPGENGIIAAVNSGRLFSSERAGESNIRAAGKTKTKVSQ